MIVAVHVPKTGGTTLKSALQSIFGERLLLDYGDRVLTQGPWSRNLGALAQTWPMRRVAADYDAVYGHFMPVKYSLVPEARFAIWLRDPVQRMASRFHHYARSDDPAPHRLPRGLTIEQFCAIKRFHNSYAKYLWGFRFERFRFVGITERYQESLGLLKRSLGIDVEASPRVLNANPERSGSEYEVPEPLRRRIIDCNALDVALYRRALQRFDRDLARSP